MAAVRRGTRLLVGLVAVVGALLLAEVVLRFHPTPRSWASGGSHPRFLVEPDAAAGYRLRPGFSGRQIAVSGEFDVAVSIGVDHTRVQPRPHGERGGVLAYGDSMTFGEGVPAEATWTALLAETVRQPVINAGVPGYSTGQMAAHLHEGLARYQPRLVLFVLSPRWDLGRCIAPFTHMEGYLVASSYVSRLHLVGDALYEDAPAVPGLPGLTAQIVGRSRIARLLSGRLNLWRRARRNAHPPPTWTEHEACFDGLSTAHALATQGGAGFLAVLVDSPLPGHARAVADLRPRLESTGIEYLALDDLLPEAEFWVRRFPLDGHWNERGHADVAAALGAYLGAARMRD